MSKTSLKGFIVACAALAACSTAESTRPLTATDATRSEASSDLGFGAMADGPLDIYFADEGASAQMASAQIAAASQSATGRRTSGHVGFNFSAPTFGLAAEQYSFAALSTDPSTLAAKGEFELMLTSATGVLQKFHGNVICMNTVGNTTRLAGLLEKVWINNVQRPITGATHVIWTVVDNGEGQGTTDFASPMFFNNATNAQTHCNVGFTPPQFPVLEGNVQVR